MKSPIDTLTVVGEGRIIGWVVPLFTALGQGPTKGAKNPQQEQSVQQGLSYVSRHARRRALIEKCLFSMGNGPFVTSYVPLKMPKPPAKSGRSESDQIWCAVHRILPQFCWR